MSNLPSSVSVAVRVRPLVSSERQEGCDTVLSVDTATNQIFSNHNADKTFAFDHAFNPNTTQEHIYNTCVKDLEARIFQGFNATLLAYGQTGSGKTYTMGTADDVQNPSTTTLGIIPRTISSIFKRIRKEADQNIAEHTIQVSFVEIHNEELRDLLTSNNTEDKTNENDCRNSNNSTQNNTNHHNNVNNVKKPSKLSIRETTDGTVFVSGLVEKTITDETEFAKILQCGSTKRATASTSMNAVSSRSHAILTVTLRRSILSEEHCEQGAPMETTAQFRLVDLAGSERAKRTQAQGARLREGININRGLLALGNVISILGGEKKTKINKDGTSSTTSTKPHVPYRNSKLTRMLQSSLGGNSCTLMIACVSPADSNFEESWNTLRYASRARNIKNTPVVNTDPQAAELLRLRTLVTQLQTQLSGESVLSPKKGTSSSIHSIHSSSPSHTNQRTIIKELQNENKILTTKLCFSNNKNKMYSDRITELESRTTSTSNTSNTSSTATSSSNNGVKDDNNVIQKQAETIRVLRSKVDILESESVAVDTMLQMPSVNELMREMNRFDEQEEEDFMQQQSSTQSPNFVPDIISMEEIEEAMLAQRELETEEIEHRK